MPYKDPRYQLNLKLTPTDYARLETEAALAETTISQFARHLLAQRGAQPLSVAAQHVRRQARQREKILRQQLVDQQQQVRTLQGALQAAAAQQAQWQQRMHTLEQELAQANAELRDPTRIQTLIEQQLEQREQASQARRTALPPVDEPKVTDIIAPHAARRRTRRP
jgi:chromosome segregation ATPase